MSIAITKKPDVCGGAACIDGTRIPVWVLVKAWNLGKTDKELQLDYPALTHRHFEQAWNYYLSHENEIEKDIENNEL